MPEGDALHRTARDLQVLVGEKLEVETPHPRARLSGVAERLDGRKLVKVEAVGKNLLLRFEDGLVLRSHLRMKGRWQVLPRDGTGGRRGMPWLVLRGAKIEAVGKNLLLRFEGGLTLRSHLRMRGRWQVRPRNGVSRGRPWLVLRGADCEAVLWNGPVLELHGRGVRTLGPDILAASPDFDAMLARFRLADKRRAVGDALLDQRLVAGIGNLWKAEALWGAKVSPWRPLGDVSDDELLATLQEAARLMRNSLERGKHRGRAAYRRAGRPCPRCGALIRSRGQGDANRIAYWCPECQKGSGHND